MASTMIGLSVAEAVLCSRANSSRVMNGCGGRLSLRDHLLNAVIGEVSIHPRRIAAVKTYQRNDKSRRIVESVTPVASVSG